VISAIVKILSLIKILIHYNPSVFFLQLKIGNILPKERTYDENMKFEKTFLEIYEILVVNLAVIS